MIQDVVDLVTCRVDVVTRLDEGDGPCGMGCTTARYSSVLDRVVSDRSPVVELGLTKTDKDTLRPQ